MKGTPICDANLLLLCQPSGVSSCPMWVSVFGAPFSVFSARVFLPVGAPLELLRPCGVSVQRDGGLFAHLHQRQTALSSCRAVSLNPYGKGSKRVPKWPLGLKPSLFNFEPHPYELLVKASPAATQLLQLYRYERSGAHDWRGG